ncbi:hypothetical protein LMG28688_06078 [Paraburkholderia caffeinitolerans]|uniref:Uncharacterized protein n=1 Tax=Paraburkholderia caffeinitolerans TaxID=1723730 RepID=A0A6J5GUC1_9BURK|nr:hypothetical protein [Paraburkholderia caffeinitolerans]CAB3804971.1 hypothetical protein LMG28688_06078 [Paraburkholderia caffeinitolerans]
MNHTSKVFHASRGSAGAAREAGIKHHAQRFLRRVAGDLRLRTGEHEIVTEPAERGRGCRVTLRTTRLMLEVADAPERSSMAVSFRTRRGRKDLSGGGDNAVSQEQLASRAGYEAFLGALRLTNGLDSERR